MSRVRMLQVAALAAGLISVQTARAEPQISFGVTTGYGVRALSEDPRGAAHLGGRGALLLSRNKNREFGFAPYVEGLTVAFNDLQLGGGLELLVPGFEGPNLVVALGPFARLAQDRWNPGASSTIFFGFRGHNFHSVYGMTNGLFVQGRLGFGDRPQAEVLGGVQIDLAILALPFLLVWGSLK